MFQLQITKEAEKFIQQKLIWRFWVIRPVVMLIEFLDGNNDLSEYESVARTIINKKEIEVYKANKNFSLSKNSTEMRKLEPVIYSLKKFPQLYLNTAIQTKNYLLIPHIKMILYEKEVSNWLLDVGEEGLTLEADGVVVSGIPENKEAISGVK